MPREGDEREEEAEEGEYGKEGIRGVDVLHRGYEEPGGEVNKPMHISKVVISCI